MAETIYDPIGVTKSRVCTLLIKSEGFREAVGYTGKAQKDNTYDPEEPMTLMWNCVFPFLKDPDTITTTDPQILVGVDSALNVCDPRTQTLFINILIVLDNDDLRTNRRYIRDDLIGDGIVAYTKADDIAKEIKLALSSQESKTWLGDVEFIESAEGSTNHAVHYHRSLRFKVKEIEPMHPANRDTL